ncbi:MAG: hypothetical protein P8M80_16595, partial [Pirellulaceae bacterium]|nr:hypothetical protein [Pirellulaceae bacterium]
MASLNDYQRAVAALRQCMQNVDSLMESEFQEIADAYNAAVSEVNVRLTRCAGLLQQGMRAQAILEANVEPNLVDAVASLDIAELFQWMQLAKQYGCAASQLDMESAKILNQAYDAHVPLEPLLRVYRKLALQRAPLSERLAVLRKIADTDSHNLAWQEDLEAFERARIEELRAEIVPLIKSIDKNVDAGNHQNLEKIFQELTGSVWTEQPPKEIINRVKAARDKSTTDIHYEQLKELELQLNDAFNELDFERARDLRDRWDGIIASCPLTHDDPVLTRAQSALGWIREEEIREEQRFEIEEAIAQLEQLLDSGGSLADIDAQIAMATKYDEPLPDYLFERVENYRIRLQKKRTQKFVALITGLFLFILASAAVGIYIAKSASDSNRVENQIAQIDKLAENENWKSVLASIKESS